MIKNLFNHHEGSIYIIENKKDKKYQAKLIELMLAHDLYSKKLRNPGCSMVILGEINSIDGTSINNSLVCISDQEGILSFFDTNNGNLLKEIPTECNSEIWALNSIPIDPNIYNLYAGAATGHVYAFKVRVKLSDSKSLSIDIDKIWDQKTDDLITKMECYDLNQDGKIELIASSMDHSLRILDAETGKLIWGQLFQSGITTFKLANLHGKEVDSVICSSTDGSLRVFNSKKGDLIKFSTMTNNIRTIEVIDTPKKIGKTELFSESPKVIVCGCDDYYLYLLDGNSLNVLSSLNIGSYIWNTGSYRSINTQNIEQFYISTYSFNFMEGLVVPNPDEKSLLRFYNAQSFEPLAEIVDINIQTITPPLNFDKYQIILVGTTEKKVHLIDLEQKKILCSIDAEDIVNAVELLKIHDKLMIFYCDDKCNFRAFKIENF